MESRDPALSSRGQGGEGRGGGGLSPASTRPRVGAHAPPFSARSYHTQDIYPEMYEDAHAQGVTLVGDSASLYRRPCFIV